MNHNKDIDLSKIGSTCRLIIERAILRGWDVANFESNSALLLLSIPGRKRPIKLFSASPSQMSYPASKIAKDKYATNQILSTINVPVPKEMLLCKHCDISTLNEAKGFLDENQRIVVKPLDASHGKGININVTTGKSLEDAILEAYKFCKSSKKILLQEYIQGVDVRAVCIGYKYVNAISRIPASVVGDGKNTVRQLIEILNSSEDRGSNYKSRYNTISIEKVGCYLSQDNINSIPENGETVQVIGVSNVGMGGTRYNITEKMPKFLQELAEMSARELELPICGIDFMVKRLPKPTDTFDDLRPVVIEANECPSLIMYEDLYSSEQNAFVDTYLDFVAT